MALLRLRAAGNVGLLCATAQATGAANAGSTSTYSVPKRVSVTQTLYSGTGVAGNFSSDIAGTTNVGTFRCSNYW